MYWSGKQKAFEIRSERRISGIILITIIALLRPFLLVVVSFSAVSLKVPKTAWIIGDADIEKYSLS